MSQGKRSGLSPLWKVLTRAAVAIDQKVGWDKLPTPVALPGPDRAAPTVPLDQPVRHLDPANRGRPARCRRHRASAISRPARRTAPTTICNDPRMGSAGTRFGRNVPLRYAYPEPEPDIMQPNPRVISRELLTRETFEPATTLNVLAAAWLQFMIKDWFSHGKGDISRAWEVPVAENDPWPQKPMLVPRTIADPTRPDGDNSGPPTYLNVETHWWDGSQLYGVNADMQKMVRTGEGGKLRLDENGMLPRPLLEMAGHEPGFWLGIALLHILFAREHNAVCDRLRAAYPAWSDDDLFDKARLVTAALLAKIHTVEWTPAIISHPTTRFALKANWWGVLQEHLTGVVGRTGKDLLTGIPSSPTDHHAAPYGLTEEFTAVYRMHPLIPDEYAFRTPTGDRPLETCSFREIAGPATAGVLERFSLADLLYTFGTDHPGAVSLHNFPKFLQEFERPDGKYQDLAAIDILRIRELGVPRYNEFRRLLHLKPARSFEELTDNPTWAAEMRRIYGDVERVDLTIGMFAEPKPKGFGFSDTAFRIFILMASRRLKSDRFFTVDYSPRVYTPEGIAWIDATDMSAILRRHVPELGPVLSRVDNAFAPWSGSRA